MHSKPLGRIQINNPITKNKNKHALFEIKCLFSEHLRSSRVVVAHSIVSVSCVEDCILVLSLLFVVNAFRCFCRL